MKNEISKGGDNMLNKKRFFLREARNSPKKEFEKKPLKNVISFKVNDMEKKMLEKLTRTTSKTSPTSCGRLWKSGNPGGPNSAWKSNRNSTNFLTNFHPVFPDETD
jgi:hypothetical protein